MRRCTYCSAPSKCSERIGSVRFDTCGEPECDRQFDDDCKDAERELDDSSRALAEQDNFDRYR